MHPWLFRMCPHGELQRPLGWERGFCTPCSAGLSGHGCPKTCRWIAAIHREMVRMGDGDLDGWGVDLARYFLGWAPPVVDCTRRRLACVTGLTGVGVGLCIESILESRGRLARRESDETARDCDCVGVGHGMGPRGHVRRGTLGGQFDCSRHRSIHLHRRLDDSISMCATCRSTQWQ